MDTAWIKKAVKEAMAEYHEEHANSMAAAKELGDPEEVRARITFVDLLIERERHRAALRRAVIEKSLIGAVWALLIFISIAVYNEVVARLQQDKNQPPPPVRVTPRTP